MFVCLYCAQHSTVQTYALCMLSSDVPLLIFDLFVFSVSPFLFFFLFFFVFFLDNKSRCWLKFCQLFQKVDEDDNSYFEMALSNSSQYTLFDPTDESFKMLTYDDLNCGETILMMSNDTSRTKCDKMVNDTSMNETVKYQTGNGNTKTNTLPKITESNGYACNAIIHERKLYASSLSFSLLLSLSFSLSLILSLIHI